MTPKQARKRGRKGGRAFTERKSPLTGLPYPRCQANDGGVQCDRAVYADGLCYKDFQVAIGQRGGRAKSEKKTAAVRENAKLGGRPAIQDEFTNRHDLSRAMKYYYRKKAQG